jgi:DNA polymerase-1
LSSSNPNLQNIPSGSVFAKLIKACFGAIGKWLFNGSDFDALEDKTGALLTGDPNRIKIYTEGFCGHCLRTQSYWPEKMPDIDPTSVDSINSIADLYPDDRQDSKAPSFALQYRGTWRTLMNNCGFSEKEAKAIEKRYHDLYQVSDAWAEDVEKEGREKGYVTMIFGARIRTPLLAKTVTKGRSVPYAAAAEARSAGNAKTQSYCFLTLRAMNEYRKRVWNSPYIYSILPAATIHDAGYYMCKNDTKLMKWHNDNLIDCMAWQELEELKHPTIKISSSLEIFYPSWKDVVKIPNHSSEREIVDICKASLKK